MPTLETRRPVERAAYWTEAIEQNVENGTWTRPALRRTLKSLVEITGWCVILGIVCWIAVIGVQQMTGAGGKPVVAAKSGPVRVLKLSTDGFLTEDWVRETLRLRPNTELLSLDLDQVRARLEANGQVRRATVRRRFPDTLIVHLMERSPVARIRTAGADGTPTDLLVDREGVAFPGFNHDPLQIGALPYLAGIKLHRVRADSYAPIDGMPEVARLLDQANEKAPHLVRRWRVISLASHPRILIRSDDIREIVFDATDFSRQIARLDYILDYQRTMGGGLLDRVDLTLGTQVAVQTPEDSPLRAMAQVDSTSTLRTR